MRAADSERAARDGFVPFRRDYLTIEVAILVAILLTALASYYREPLSSEEQSFTPLGAAVRGRKLDMVKHLLERGADPKIPEDRPWAQPLAYAKMWGHDEIARFLEAQP